MEVTRLRIAVIDDNGTKRLARLHEMPDDQQEALLARAVALHDLSGPEPVSEIDGVVHRRGRPDPDHQRPSERIRAEIAERRKQRGGGKSGGKPNRSRP